ncbi:MAG: DUF5123 domain-containing protein [Ignavibacteriales bacterium]|nr:DUF5123 domain-containing protein [Ignavibacteriales bacterium]
MKRISTIVITLAFASLGAMTWAQPGGYAVPDDYIDEADVYISHVSLQPNQDYVTNSSQPDVDGWPSVGDTVRFLAVLGNRDVNNRASQCSYKVYVNGVEEKDVSFVGVRAIKHGGYNVVDYYYDYIWTGDRDTIEFVVDYNDNTIEPEENNNSYTIYTDAIRVAFYVEYSLYWEFHERQRYLSGASSNGFEDWAHRQMDSLNAKAQAAGVDDRFRVDTIVVVSDGSLPLAGGTALGSPNRNDKSIDIQLGYTATMDDYDDSTTVSGANPAYYDYETLQRSLETRYCITLDAWDVYDDASTRNIAVQEDGAYVAGSDYMPWLGAYDDAVYYTEREGIMGDVGDSIAAYTADALNQIAGYRATDGNYNPPGNQYAFLQDLPSENRLTVYGADSELLVGATVKIYQSTGDGTTWYGKAYDNSPDLWLTTDANGQTLLGQCPFSSDGTLYHEYGNSNLTAIVRVEYEGNVDYGFLESADFNMQYWAGNTSLGEYDYHTSYESHFVEVVAPNGGELWRVGNTMDIQWNSAGATNLKLEYSTNGGSTWTTIVASTSASLGRYTWTIPNDVSTNCLVRAEDVDDATEADTSDASFEIVQADLTLTDPNGGETWTIGDGYDITWTQSGIPEVRLEYSTDSGSTWDTITASTSGYSNSYYWTVDAPASANGMLRIVDAYDSTLADTSDAVLTFASPSGSPATWYVDDDAGTGGAGTSGDPFDEITDALSAASADDTIKVSPGTYTTTDPGSTPTGIVLISTDGAGSTTIDGTTLWGEAFEVKAGWHIEGFTFTNFDDGDFDLGVLVFPAAADSSETIIVRDNIFDGNTKVIYGEDGSSAEALIDHNEFLNGTNQVVVGEFRSLKLYNNTFYENDSLAAKYIVDVYSKSQSETRVDMRNNVFVGNDVDASSVAVARVYPAADGTTAKLTEGYNLFYNNSADSVVTETIANRTTVDTRPGYTTKEDPLFVDGASGDFTLLSGSPAFDDGVDVGLAYSDAAPEKGAYEGGVVGVTLTNPDGGEQYGVDQDVNVTWSATNLTNVKLEFSSDDGASYSSIVASTDATTGSYAWTVPNDISQTCKIRITSIEHPQLADSSDAVFRIRSPFNLYVATSGSPGATGIESDPVPTIYEALTIAVEGDTINVEPGTYTNTYYTSPPENILLQSTDGAASTTINCASMSDAAIYVRENWTIDGFTFENHGGPIIEHADDVDSNGIIIFRNNVLNSCDQFNTDRDGYAHYRLMYNVINDPSFRFIYSSFVRFEFWHNTVYGGGGNQNFFFVLPEGDAIELDIQNNIFDGVDIGSNEFLYVNYYGGDPTVILRYGYNLWYNNSSDTLAIKNESSNPNTYREILQNNVTGSDPVYTDAASGDFTLQSTSPAINRGHDIGYDFASSAPDMGAYEYDAPSSLTLTSPTGGETLSIGSSHSVTWTQDNVGYLNIDYSTDNGSTWTDVADSVLASDLSYSWTVPYPPSTECLLRIVDDFNASVTDESTAFEIKNDTIYVASSGGDYTDIATALTNAEDGATIFVAAGTYTTAGVASPPMGVEMLSEDGYASTTIDGSSLSGLGFTVLDGWTIDGFTFTNFNDGGSMSAAAIVFDAASDSTYGVTIKNNFFDAGTKAIVGEQGSNAEALVHNNIFADMTERVVYGEWRELKFYNNTIDGLSNASDNYAIDVHGSSGGQTEVRLDVRNNIFSNNTVASGGGALVRGSAGASGNFFLLKEGYNLYYNNSPNDSVLLSSVSGDVTSEQRFGNDVEGVSPAFEDRTTDDYNLDGTSPAIVAGMDVGLPFTGTAPDLGALGYSGTLTLTAPDGGESWTSGTSQNITWTSDNVANVKIELTTDNGSTWTVQEASVDASTGSHSWTVPDYPSTTCKIRLSIAETDAPQDTSAAVFEILGANSPVIDGNLTVETQWGTALFTDAQTGTYPSHIDELYATYDANYVYFGILLEEDDCRNNATVVIDYKDGGPAANAVDPFMDHVKYNFTEQPDYVIHKHGYDSAIAAKRWNGSSWEDRTAPITNATGFHSDYNSGSGYFLEIKLERAELEDAALVNFMVYTSQGTNDTYPADVDKCAFFTYPEDAGNQTDFTANPGPTVFTTQSVYDEGFQISSDPNVNLGGPYTNDANTMALLHFDGDYTNAGATGAGTAVNGTNQSFVSHTEAGLANLRQALRLDNSSSTNKTYVQVADAADLDMTGDWTVECWFKLNSFGTENGHAYAPRLVSKPDGDDPFGNYWITLFGNTSEAQVGTQTTTSGTYNTLKSDSAFIQTGNWYHVSYVRDATNEMMAMVIHDANRDPIFVQTKSLSGIANTPVTTASDLYIGWAGGSYTDLYYFDGWIDEVRVSNTVRGFTMPPVIENVTTLANQSQNASGFAVQADIYSLGSAASLVEQRLYYSLDEGASWTSTPMTVVSGSTYAGTIPNQAKGSVIDYYVWAKDDLNAESRYPAGVDETIQFGVYRDADKVLDLAFEQNYTDQSIYSLNPTLTGAITYTTDKKEGSYSGRFQTATTRPYLSADSPFFTGEKFDVEFWFKTYEALRDRTYLIIRPYLPGATVNENYSIMLNANGSLRARYRVDFDLGIQAVDLSLPANSVQLGQWLKVKYQRTDDSVYVSLYNSLGSLIAHASNTSVSAKPPNLAMGTLRIGYAGNQYDGNDAYFTGLIDGLKINNLSRSLGKPFPPVDPEWVGLEIADKNGDMATLYLTDDFEAASKFPPLPKLPEGAFDVRFSTDRFVEVTGGKRRVSVKGVEKPFTLKTTGGSAIRVTDAFGGAHFDETIRDGESITIDNDAIDELIIEEWAIPEEFALRQNFPNPFNPTTTIQFELPVDSWVTLDVFDVLGQRVATLKNEDMKAGVYKMKWNAANYASGVYFYRIEAKDFNAVKKMMLLK